MVGCFWVGDVHGQGNLMGYRPQCAACMVLEFNFGVGVRCFCRV